MKQWKGGPVKIDPLALVQAIERYLVVRGTFPICVFCVYMYIGLGILGNVETISLSIAASVKT